MMSERSGGCLCGKVRYTLTGDPVAMAICHCRHCQKTAGSAFSVIAVAPQTAFNVTGETRIYHDTGDSGGRVDRHFCPSCGSPIQSRTAGLDAQGLTAIKAAGFDAVDWLKPAVQVYCDSEQPWLSGLASLPRIAKSPG